jgi:hypothetical protein
MPPELRHLPFPAVLRRDRTHGYTVAFDGETVYDVARLVYQVRGEHVIDDVVRWIQQTNAGRMMRDGAILNGEVFLRRGWRLVVPAPPAPGPSRYTGQLLTAALLGSVAASVACLGWYLLQHHA